MSQRRYPENQRQMIFTIIREFLIIPYVKDFISIKLNYTAPPWKREFDVKENIIYEYVIHSYSLL